MNILELDSFNLADAVKFNDRLNPRLWSGNKMRPEVREKLLAIAADFKESLGLSDLDVKDITVSGSNAGFTYTPHSDIDLHLVVRMPDHCDEVYQELFNAKKYQYNDEHDIKIGGYDVELYVQPADQPHVSAGVYSVMNDDWVHIPRKVPATANDAVVKDKYDLVKSAIESALKSKDINKMRKVWDKVKEMRKAGLAKNGELGPENLAFKMLRTQGDLGELKDTIRRARDAELSLAEQNKERKPFVYGFKSVEEDATLTPDGVNPTTCMFLNEQDPVSDEDILRDFITFVARELKLKELPIIKLRRDPQWPVVHTTFGRYMDDKNMLEVAWGQRHIMDVLRTVAHELTHRRQHEREDVPMDAGETGSPYENEANARAGILMRDYARLHPEYFEKGQAQGLHGDEVNESASGYIPTAREKNDPRYKMALTVDIKPGQVGKEANKLALDTDRQGKPGLLMKTVNLREGTKTKSYGYNSTPLSQVPGEIEDELGNQEATGPEFPPRMPAGTTKIDVSDLTDWYRLGQDISDMDDADPEDYGKGPPQTVIVFPSDEAEQGYLKQFKRLGLKTHDIDPDVPGGEDLYGKHLRNKLSKELREFKEQDLFEIKMSPSSLKAEAAKTGAMAGMEFEMIVPNVQANEEPEYEPDYDQDQRSRSFSDIRDFFYDGDYNSRRDVDRLEEAVREQYEEWLWEKLGEAWDDQGQEYLKEYIEVNDEFDEEEATEEATNQLQAEYGDDITPEGFQKMLDAMVAEKFNEFVDEAWSDQGRLYDNARESFMDEMRDEYDDEREWLDENYPYMSDISNNFDISWPYYTTGDEGELDIESVADDFSNAVGMKTNWSSSYHGGRREPNAYVVEPDGSLDPDDSNDGGLEFVSPPMPIDQMIEQLNKVKAWADDRGCYTNKSTGLHINISVPNYDLAKLDYVKLALLLGDKYVLDQYGRSSNTYAKSALGKVQDLIRRDPSKGKDLLDKMRGHMEDLATKAIHSGSTDKYTSINTKSGYIEFRSPGGDWLNENFDKIENTLMRFTVALSAAMDPEAYREEYLKKLYKLLEPVAEEAKNKDTIKFFSDYVAGKMPKAALRSFIKQAQLERKIKRGQTDGKTDYWWDVWRDGNVPNGPGVQVVAKTREEALTKAAKEFGLASPEYMPSATAEPIRPFDTSAVKAQVGEPQALGQQGNWGIWMTGENRFSRAPGQTDNSVLRRFPSREAAEQWIEQTRAQRPDMRTDIEVREIEPTRSAGAPREYEIFADTDPFTVVRSFYAADDQAAQAILDQYRRDHPGTYYRAHRAPVPGSTLALQRQRATAAQQVPQTPDQQQGGLVDVAGETPAATGEFTGNWRILDAQGREIHRFGGIGNSQSDANNFAIRWLQQNPRYMQAGVEVVPEMA